MTHNTKPSDYRSRLFRQRSFLLSISCLTSFGLLSSSLVRASETQAPTDDFLAPATLEFESQEETWEPAPYTPPPAPVYMEPIDHGYSEPTWEPAPAPSYSEPIDHGYSEPTWEPAPAPSYPEPIDHGYSQPIEAPAPVAETWEPEPIAPPPIPYTTEVPANNYIDPTEYTIGATDSYEAPTAVVFSERTSGCEATITRGEMPSSWCSPPPAVTTASNSSNNSGNLSGGNNDSNTPINPANSVSYYNNSPSNHGNSYHQTPASYSPSNSDSYSAASYSSASSSIPSAAITPIQITGISSSGLAYYNRTQRPRKMIGNNDTHLLFPLSIPAAITSAFGWRQHPILGIGKFHTGIDFGVDEGVPVVAAYSGQVAIADWLGGYGLTVVLQHATKSKETLYAHLSELFVQPGEWVEQGEIIGRVGTTGMSTGPHLHFELRQLTAQGWITVDPGKQIEYATAQLLNLLKMTKVPAPPKVSPEELAKQAKDIAGKPQLIPAPPGIEITITNLEPPPLLKPSTKPESE